MGIDVLVGFIRQHHHFAYGCRVIAGFIKPLNARAGGHELGEQGGFRQAGRQTAFEAAGEEAGTATADIHYLADDFGVEAAGEVFKAQVHVIEARSELAGEVEAQRLRRQQVKVLARGDERATALRHLLTIHGEEAVNEYAIGGAHPGAVQYGRPEQRMEIQDVFANEVVELGARRACAFCPPEFIMGSCYVHAALGGQGIEAADIADGCIEPDVEKLARGPGNTKAEVRRVARNVPITKACGEPLVQLVGDACIHGAATHPLFQQGFEVAQLKEQVFAVALFRRGARDGRHRVDEFGRGVGGATFLAAVAILVRCLAARAGALDVAVRQEHTGLGVVGLTNGAAGDVTGRVQ